MACDDKKRGSLALPTIQESEEDSDHVIIEDILRTSRKKRECRTPSKKNSSAEKSKSSDSSARKRSSRQSAEHARVKITTLFNQSDKHGRSIYAVSEDGITSEDSSEAFQPIADEEVMPRGECKCASIHAFLNYSFKFYLLECQLERDIHCNCFLISFTQMVETVKMKK